MHITNPPRYDDIDWVALARSMGLYVSIGPFKLSNISGEYMHHLVSEHLSSLRSGVVEYNALMDHLSYEVVIGTLTSFDAACIKLYIRREYKS